MRCIYLVVCFVFFLHFFVALASPVVHELMILSPSALVFQETTVIKWSGGAPPFTLSINASVDGGSLTSIATLDNQTSPVAWVVDIAPGSSITFELRDGSGLATNTPLITVQPRKAEADGDLASNDESQTRSVTSWYYWGHLSNTQSAITLGVGIGLACLIVLVSACCRSGSEK
ncbi:hypothetical protein PM082_014284 [Marasmius tenuissimus]|nr:hypothetical protein PM082_014284 [Marasmius tenuissimus]